MVVKEFPIPEHWPRGYGVEIRWNDIAVIWGALDPDSDVLYLTSEYSGSADPAVHVAAIRARGEWIPGLIDPTANGRDRLDGGRLIQMYQNLGLQLHYINNSTESGILEVSQRMRSGRLKVFPSLSKYLGERRLYRRDENNQVVKERDNLQDATRCLVLGRAAMESATEIDPDDEPFYNTNFSHGPGAWMA